MRRGRYEVRGRIAAHQHERFARGQAVPERLERDGFGEVAALCQGVDHLAVDPQTALAPQRRDGLPDDLLEQRGVGSAVPHQPPERVERVSHDEPPGRDRGGHGDVPPLELVHDRRPIHGPSHHQQDVAGLIAVSKKSGHCLRARSVAIEKLDEVFRGRLPARDTFTNAHSSLAYSSTTGSGCGRSN